MERIELKSGGALRGEATPPPDKSISHRAVMFSSIASGKSVVRNFLRAGDTMSTLNAMRALGISINDAGKDVIIDGRGTVGALKKASGPIDCGNSGTTMRLLSGILAGQPFASRLFGDASLTKRPMKRIITPLRAMGAEISAEGEDTYPPLAISSGNLRGIKYESPISSAQVKSCVLLAGLFADGTTVVTEPEKSRDHTERMLPAFGARLTASGLSVSIEGGSELRATDCAVPGDFSSAAFFIVGALIAEGSELYARNVCLNPTRTGLLEVLKMMGASVKVEGAREVSGEPVGDIYVKGSQGLRGVVVPKTIVPSMIDEFPILCIAAALASGLTSIRGAEELRKKESDRIRAMADGLRKMGVPVTERPDGLDIEGRGSLSQADIDANDDHRIAMSFAIASLRAEGPVAINGASSVGISFPGFFNILAELRR